MADVNFLCTTSKCLTRVDERALTAGGNHFLHKRWVAAVRAGACTTCEAHYHDANSAQYQSYAKDVSRRNRESS